jgi:hypothetical protein
MKIQNRYHDLIEFETRGLKEFRCTGYVLRKIDVVVRALTIDEAVDIVYKVPTSSFKMEDMHVEATEIGQANWDASGQDRIQN